MSGEMNRRGFIKGAGVLAAAACGGAAKGGALNVARSPSAPNSVKSLFQPGSNALAPAPFAGASIWKRSNSQKASRNSEILLSRIAKRSAPFSFRNP